MWNSNCTLCICPSTGRVTIIPKMSSSYVSFSTTPTKESYFDAGTMVSYRELLSAGTSCCDKYANQISSPFKRCNTAPSPSPLPSFMFDQTSTAACLAAYLSCVTFSHYSSSSIYCLWPMSNLIFFIFTSLSGITLK